MYFLQFTKIFYIEKHLNLANFPNQAVPDDDCKDNDDTDPIQWVMIFSQHLLINPCDYKT